jgi:hypothetical protein
MQGEMNRGGHVPEGVTTHGGPYRSFVVCPVRKLLYSRWGTGGGLGIVGTVALIAVVLYLLGVIHKRHSA